MLVTIVLLYFFSFFFLSFFLSCVLIFAADESVCATELQAEEFLSDNENSGESYFPYISCVL